MASGGSSSRSQSGSRSFGFGSGSDDVLFSYDDYSGQDPTNGRRPDPAGKDFHDNRTGRPLVNIYEQEDYCKEDVTAVVEKCMKKYADNLLRSLEGIGGRLSQLEIYCYKLERSICEFRSDMIRDQSEADLKFKSLEKHLQEVHRSVQILRDRQELAEAQKELGKLQLIQKDSTQKNEEGITPSLSESKKHDDKLEVSNQQMALVLPPQAKATQSIPPRASEPIQPYRELTMPQPAPSSLSVQPDRYMVNQAGAYYMQGQTLTQVAQSQQLQPEMQYVQIRPQVQDVPVQTPPQHSQIVSQAQSQPFLQYQQQWPQQPSQQFPQQVGQTQPPSQQFPTQVMQPQPPASQVQIKLQASPSYHYAPHQPANPIAATFPGSMAMQVPYSAIPQQVGNHPEIVPFVSGGSGSTISQPATHNTTQGQHQPPSSQRSFGPQPSKGGYTSAAPYTPPANVQGYNTPGLHHPGTQLRNHPYGEMIEKAVSMGYPRDLVLNLVDRMTVGGQTMDFNALLDGLSGRGSGAPPRVWSG
ncbi:uncharacterized protein [Typha latifolia]|uniref:uncharacterized protein n=1 Tax=Typha latifolia TaxID=4733 RepID=UPI003C2D3A1A